MIKIIASDMDGTLLDSEHKLPENFGEVLNTIKEKGAIFGVATGRPYLSTLKYFEGYEDDMFFICENGASIHYRGKCIHSIKLNINTVNKLIRIGRKVPNAYLVLACEDGQYVENEIAADLINRTNSVKADIKIVDSLLDVKDGVLKVNMYDVIEAEHNSYLHFKDVFIDGVDVKPSGKNWLDVSSQEINKGVAIKKVQEIFNASPEETMVFGDYLNDLEMMDVAYYSYAMENGHPQLKEKANFITGTNDENSVLNTILEMLDK